MNRTRATTRLYLLRPVSHFSLPWGIALCSFAINLVVWWAADLASVPGVFTGGVSAFYIWVAAVYVVAVTQLWPFAASLGVTRRTFTLASLSVAGAQAAAYGVVLVVLVVVEDATDGWGVGLHFWAPGPLHASHLAAQMLACAVLVMACAAVGLVVGVVYKRWGRWGILGVGVAVLTVLGAVPIVLTRLPSWGETGLWLTRQSALSLTIGISATATVLLVGLASLLLHGTDP